MTRINKLVMNGFKSFAKHTEMQFSSSFNCVLGPNGSGKSNVLDALCFVLGKTSAKSMRAEKASNLIYNGGKEKKQAKQGEVSIYFSNEDKKFPTEEPEVKVTRIVRQNGQSIYKINDVVRTRQQIIDLLNTAKIDPDGYNIILQGDIIRFCEMAPTERRLLIEEISGISVYEEKKHKALLELEKVDKRLNDAEIVLKERNSYLKELKKDRDQALKFKEMNDKIKMYKASLVKIQIDKREAEKKDFGSKHESAKQELESLKKKIDELRKSNEQKNQEIQAIAKDIEEKGEVEQVNLNKEIEALKIELARKGSRLETVKSELNKIAARKVELKNSVKDIDAKVAGIDQKKETLAKQKKNRESEKESITKRLKTIREKNNLDNLSDIDKQIEELDKNAEELQKQINSMREEQHNLIRNKDGIQHQLNVIDEQIKKVAEIEKEHKDQIEGLKNKRQEFKKSTLELNKRLDMDSNFAAQLGSAKDKLARAESELAKLKVKQMTIAEFSLGEGAVKRILAQKNHMRGIYGTVAELGVVNSKYSLALEMAAGSRIKSIVVEDDKVAADCIKYLKQNKLGVATFLPLTKLKSTSPDAELKGLSKTKGCAGLAIDLVDFDNKFKKVFQYVFANTIVVDNIDVARRIGIGKSKMVTLDGDVAESSGVMKGGYRDKKRAGLGFSQKEITKDLNEYQEVVNNLQGDISSVEAKRSENEGIISGLREKKAQLEGEIIVTEKSLHLDSTDLEASLGRKDDLKDELKRVDNDINQKQNTISGLTRTLANHKIDKQKLRNKITELRNPALVAELSAFEEKLRQLNEEIIKIDSELKNMEMQSTTIFNPEKTKTIDIVKQLGVEEEKFTKESAEIAASIKDYNKTLVDKERSAKEFYAKFKALFAKQNQIKEEMSKNEININNKQNDSVRVEIRLNTLSLKLAEVSAMLSGLEHEFKQYEGVKLEMNKNEDQLKYEVNKFEKMKDDIGSVNMRALEIYGEVEKEYNSLLEKRASLDSEKNDVVNMMNEIEGRKKELFMRTFDIINNNFKEIFCELSTKGDAFLDLENRENPFEGGVNIKVKITGQKFLDIRSLSGGEKTMTALAFIFSIQEHEPASFYVLDEVDAALDKHNSNMLAKLVKRYSDRAQYVIISHNDGVISEAETLYGVSMNEHGMSKVVSLRV
ncbi:MAG: chromosome segregation protein SMC [Nanoarchaeota archaeon]|nr:chromosome segregation protein SMC [Nanoarchaeota archaeon]